MSYRIIVLFIFFSTVCAAQQQGSSEINPVLNRNLATTTIPDESLKQYPISKIHWIHHFSNNFTKDFCEQTTWLKTCYQTTEEDCQKLMTQKLSKCIPQKGQNFPIKNLQTSKTLAQKVGECLGERFQEKYPLKSKDVDLCYLDLF